MVKNIDTKTFEILSRKVEVTKAIETDFNYIEEVLVDYNTAKMLVAKGKPVYRKVIKIANGTTKQLFFVKLSSAHYMEFLEINALRI